MKTVLPLGLYLHIPFCKAKCIYCDFYSLPHAEDRMDAYTDALCAHLTEAAPNAASHTVDTIYFGGGTPSYLGEKRLCKILKTVQKRYHISRDAEITLEANPDSAGDWKALRALRRCGFSPPAMKSCAPSAECIPWSRYSRRWRLPEGQKSKMCLSTLFTACPTRRRSTGWKIWPPPWHWPRNT